MSDSDHLEPNLNNSSINYNNSNNESDSDNDLVSGLTFNSGISIDNPATPTRIGHSGNINTDPNADIPPYSPPYPQKIWLARPYLSEVQIKQLINSKKEKKDIGSSHVQLWVNISKFIIALCKELRFPERTLLTSLILFKRYTLFNILSEHRAHDIAIACIFLSTKIEDTLKKLKEIIICSYSIRRPNLPPIDIESPAVDEMKRKIMALERQILETIAFDFRSRHPHKLIVKLGKNLLFSKDITNLAYKISSDSYLSMAPLKFTPQTIALASLDISQRITIAIRTIQEIELKKQQSSNENKITDKNNDIGENNANSKTNANINRKTNHSVLEPPPSLESSFSEFISFVPTLYHTTAKEINECKDEIFDLYTDYLSHTRLFFLPQFKNSSTSAQIILAARLSYTQKKTYISTDDNDSKANTEKKEEKDEKKDNDEKDTTKRNGKFGRTFTRRRALRQFKKGKDDNKEANESDLNLKNEVVEEDLKSKLNREISNVEIRDAEMGDKGTIRFVLELGRNNVIEEREEAAKLNLNLVEYG